jgi:RHS repeat-associated protein
MQTLAFHRVIVLPVLFLWLAISFTSIAQPTSTESPVNEVRTQLLSLSAVQFAEPLLATSSTGADEDAALLAAIQQYQARTSEDDYQALIHFLATYPNSGWRVALQTNLGISYYQAGRFSKAIAVWEDAWQRGKTVTEPHAKALVDRALGELMRMHARIGHADRLSALFAEMGDRAVSGSATEFVAGAKEGLWMMHHKPEISYLCGPVALKNLLLSQGRKPEQVAFLSKYRSGKHGVSFTQVGQLAKQAKLPYTLIKRSPDQAVPVPSIVHWKVSHYAAIIGEENGRYHIKDPIFGEDLWVTRDAIDSEASGYYLIPSRQLQLGWQTAQLSEANQLHGMGYTGSVDPKATQPDDDKSKPSGFCHGMCGYNFTEMVVSLNLKDTPVGYAPPIGPAVYTTLTYNQREASQPANFGFFNISPKWSLNWLSYIQDDPAVAGSNVLRMVAGGGSVSYSGYNSSNGQFTPETRSNAQLVLVSSNPVVYQRRLSDGSLEEYSQSNGATVAPRRVFLKKLMDAQGNALTLNYDNQQRLTSITDATGRNTTFSYNNVAQPLLITAITDPFGRSAQLSYDSTGRLSSITDVIGLTSSFHYNAAALIDSMTTPYGTTSFSFGEDGTWRWLQATDPLGKTERLEYRQQAPNVPSSDPAATVPQGINSFDSYLDGRNTFYWDKHAYALAVGAGGTMDYNKARLKHWLHWSDNTNVTSAPIESIKYPYENRLWFNYPNQSWSAASSSSEQPSRVARVLDDGTTQLTQYSYNAFGNITQAIDPLGRETQYNYANNQIDLLSVAQKTATNTYATLAQATYNAQHLPTSSTDAAGQTTRYSYNAAGQLIQLTNPLNQVTRYNYNTQGYLTSVINANGNTELTLTYNNGQVATRTDSEGHILRYSYDNLDRLTAVTYPDGTSQTISWNKLDKASVTDRLGRVTQYQYDANRNLIRVTDPLNNPTDYYYYPNGTLKSLVDANNNTTTWQRDLQSRVTEKQYADGTKDTFIYENTTSRLKSKTDGIGQIKQYSYAKDNKITRIAYPNAINPTATVNFSYDTVLPQLVEMLDGTGSTQYTYYPIGQLGALKLKQEDGAYQNDTLSYQYDALGRITTRTIDTTNETFTYDALGRVTNHTSPLGTFVRSYLGETEQPTGEHKQTTTGLGLGTDWQYDSNANDRRLLGITHTKGKNFSYTRTPEDTITNIHETSSLSTNTTRDWLFDYDANDRVTKVTVPNDIVYQHQYDPVNNLLVSNYSKVGSNATSSEILSYNNLNQVLTNTQYGRTTSYDANGNMTSFVHTGGRSQSYRWDAENRLVKIMPDPAHYSNNYGTTTTLQYDGLGRFTKIITERRNYGAKIFTERRFRWCGDELCQSRDGADTVQKHYYQEGTHSLIANTESTYDIKDHLGSVHNTVGINSQTLAGDSYYLPYGVEYKTTSSFPMNDFRYAGMFYLTDESLYLTRYRAYVTGDTVDFAASRWLSRDPIAEEGGINLYGYVGANPVNLRDPLGLWAHGSDGGGAVSCPSCHVDTIERCLDGFSRMFNKASDSGDEGDAKQCDNECPIPEKAHGNRADDRPATRYKKYDKDGNFRKHGITKNEDPTKRYTKKQIDGGTIIPIERGPRKDMLKKERDLVETEPGPDNHEPWAGRRSGQ